MKVRKHFRSPSNDLSSSDKDDNSSDGSQAASSHSNDVSANSPCRGASIPCQSLQDVSSQSSAHSPSNTYPIKLPDGSKYAGEMSNAHDKPHGHGKNVWAGGECEGEFRAGKKHCTGKLKYKNC
eukprot:708681_1